MRARTNRATSVNVCVGIGGHPPGPVSIDRARPSWRRQVQTTNASKCIQFLRPSIPKDESLRKLSSFRKLTLTLYKLMEAYGKLKKA